MMPSTSFVSSLPWTSPLTTATGARPQQPRQRTASTEKRPSSVVALSPTPSFFSVARGAEAHLDVVLAGLLQAEEVVERHHAVDLRQRHVEHLGYLQRYVARDVPEGLLDAVQHHDEVARLRLPFFDEGLQFRRHRLEFFAHVCCVLSLVQIAVCFGQAPPFKGKTSALGEIISQTVRVRQG